MNILRKKDFKLTKIYADITDESGDCLIIYLAQLEIYYFRFWYTGVINSSGKDEVLERSVFRKFRMPQITEVLTLDQKRIQTHGTWERVMDPLHLSIKINRDGNALTWDCHHPKALAKVSCNGKTYNGFGYSETLSLPFFPDKLRIAELRWGRFLSADHTVIWLDITGIYHFSKVFYNGKEYNSLSIDDNSIAFCDGNFILNFGEIRTIRMNKLDNVIKGLPFLRLFISRQVLNALEIKYMAKSSLCINSIIVSHGWSIYEHVKWKN